MGGVRAGADYMTETAGGVAAEPAAMEGFILRGVSYGAILTMPAEIPYVADLPAALVGRTGSEFFFLQQEGRGRAHHRPKTTTPGGGTCRGTDTGDLPSRRIGL